MTLEQQVVSLELSKKLKELGVKQESVCWWQLAMKMSDLPFNKRPFQEREGWFLTNSENLDWCVKDVRCAAFTVAELGEMFGDLRPNRVATYQDKVDYENQPSKIFWVCEYQDYHYDFKADFDSTAETEADARAYMLIHLIEQEIVKP